MAFNLIFTKEADTNMKELEDTPSKAGILKQVRKTLGFLQTNLRHPSLKTHTYSSIENPYDAQQKVFEAYAQNKTSSAYRIFWCYGPKRGDITIIAITPHP